MAENYSRAVTDFKNAASRPSMIGGGDLMGMYNSGGSLYTVGHRPGPNGIGRGLEEQISKGVNFFGYGRNQTGSTTAGQGDNFTSNNKAGGDAQGKQKGKTGEYDLITGFTPGQKQMGKAGHGSDFGGQAAGIAKVASSSWYTSGLSEVARYGVSGAASSISNLSGRGDSERHSGNKSTGDGRAS
jgi:hypothetical protein